MRIYYLLILIGLLSSSCVKLPIIENNSELWVSLDESSKIGQHEAVLYFRLDDFDDRYEEEITFFYKEIIDEGEWHTIKANRSEMNFFSYQIELSNLVPDATYIYFLSTTSGQLSRVEHFETKSLDEPVLSTKVEMLEGGKGFRLIGTIENKGVYEGVSQCGFEYSKDSYGYYSSSIDVDNLGKDGNSYNQFSASYSETLYPFSIGETYYIVSFAYFRGKSEKVKGNKIRFTPRWY